MRLHRPPSFVRLHGSTSCATAWVDCFLCATAWADFIACGCIDRLYYIMCGSMDRLYCVRLHGPTLLTYYAACISRLSCSWVHAPSSEYYNNHKTKSCCVLTAPTLTSKRPRLWLTTWLNGYCSLIRYAQQISTGVLRNVASEVNRLDAVSRTLHSRRNVWTVFVLRA